MSDGWWEYQTDEGTLIFRPVEDLFPPIFGLLEFGEKPAWELEENLATDFQLTARERRAVLANGHRAWENHAWALSRLGRRKSITKVRVRAAPGGGRREIYRLNK
jgi:hypothetical protein